MSNSRDAPNPLRPYYRPPSVGIPADLPGTTSSGTHGLGPKNGSAASYASSARDMFSDIDYSDYLTESSPSVIQSIKQQLDNWTYRYMSVLLAQPFDVAKTILQVRSHALEDGIASEEAELQPRHSNYRNSVHHDDPFDDSDPDEPTYFTSTAPSTLSFSGSPSRSRRRLVSDRSYSTSPSPPQSKPSPPPPHQLVLKKPDSILEVISQEWAKESGWGVWKASNTTFVYNLLLETLEKWSRGVLSALLNVPDPGLGLTVELAGSQYPWVSLGVAVAAAAVAGVLLAPLDLIRTKFIILPTSASKRSLTTQLRTLTSYLCPTPLILPTLLHSLVTPTISHSTPLLLRSYLSIDPVLTPGTYQMMRLFSRAAELVIKLPLETVLRRGQMAVLKEEAELTRGEGVWAGDMETVVNIGDYNGVLGTMWSIVREEGVREPPPATGKNAKSKTLGKPIKGQGLPGLWRGWRVGMWGLVGIWTSKQLGGGANGGEF